MNLPMIQTIRYTVSHAVAIPCSRCYGVCWHRSTLRRRSTPSPEARNQVSNTARGLLSLLAIVASLDGCVQIFEVRRETAPVRAMQDAMLAGDLAKLQELAAREPKLIRTRDHKLHQTPLHWASLAGHEDVVAWLLAQAADVEAKDRGGNTPLHEAAYAGRTQVAELLLDGGADANASNDSGYAPLAMAAYNQHLETAKLLVARGAKIDCGPSGTDLIAPFVKYGNKEGVEWALLEGSRVVDERQWASEGGVKVGGENVPGWTAMHWLAKGVSVSKEEALAATLLNGDRLTHERSAKDVQDTKYLEVFRVLVANGATVNPRDQNEETPLHVAAESDNLVVATALLDTGAEIDPRNLFEETPLAMAAKLLYGDIVKLLVARGSDVNARDHVGFTPLIAATSWGSREAGIRQVAEILIAGGVDVNARKPGGGWGRAGNDGLTALQQAAEFGFTSVVDLLIRNGANVNMAFADGRTPLYWAARNGHRDVVALLIEHRANVNAEAKGRTALQAARESGHNGIIEMLLAHGATK